MEGKKLEGAKFDVFIVHASDGTKKEFDLGGLYVFRDVEPNHENCQ